MKRTVPIFVPLTFLILLISSCGKDNPADSDSDTYATPKTYTITGRILESGTGLSGVSVRLTGAGKDTTASTTSTGVYV